MARRGLTFRVFASSPFSDTVAERSALQEQVVPKLSEHCQHKNARFQAIDLRSGVGEEAALDQQTMNVCIRELHRCQQLSPRPNWDAVADLLTDWHFLEAKAEAHPDLPEQQCIE